MNAETLKKRPRRWTYIVIISVLVVIAAVAVFLFVKITRPDPIITDVTTRLGDNGSTYRVFVTVGNNGASGNVKVFVTVNWTEYGTAGFGQTQNETIYLDKGGKTTLTFEFHTDWYWFAIGVVSRDVWAVVP
jgi:hypothetical protein